LPALGERPKKGKQPQFTESARYID